MNKESSSTPSNTKPENNGNKYKQIRLLGEGSFGKAYLVECIEDKVTINTFIYILYFNKQLFIYLIITFNCIIKTINKPNFIINLLIVLIFN